jgi:hypothetical protein
MSADAIVIISNHYTEGRLAKEFGRLPLCFLPDGVHRLFERQIAWAKTHSDTVLLLLPEDCDIVRSDRSIIARMGAHILLANSELKFQQALQHVQAEIAKPKLKAIAGHTCFISGENPNSETRDAYFQERRQKLDARNFNSIHCHGSTITKHGQSDRKILAEMAWYQSLPPTLRQFAPRLVASNLQAEPSYQMEYLDLPLISELYLFAALPMESWRSILKSCCGFLETCQSIGPHEGAASIQFCKTFYKEIFVKKSLSRLKSYCHGAGINMKKTWTINSSTCGSLEDVLANLIAKIPETQPSDMAFWHGDFHFGNIFYDSSSRSIKTIDPRGMLPDGKPCLFGDVRYDIAKLHHSVIGMYDYVLAGRYRLVQNEDYDFSISFLCDTNLLLPKIQREFQSMTIGKHQGGDNAIAAISSLLFLSMLPLHSDRPEMQRAMLVNGLRLAQTVLQSESQNRTAAPAPRVAHSNLGYFMR